MAVKGLKVKTVESSRFSLGGNSIFVFAAPQRGQEDETAVNHRPLVGKDKYESYNLWAADLNNRSTRTHIKLSPSFPFGIFSELFNACC